MTDAGADGATGASVAWSADGVRRPGLVSATPPSLNAMATIALATIRRPECVTSHLVRANTSLSPHTVLSYFTVIFIQTVLGVPGSVVVLIKIF